MEAGRSTYKLISGKHDISTTVLVANHSECQTNSIPMSMCNCELYDCITQDGSQTDGCSKRLKIENLTLRAHRLTRRVATTRHESSRRRVAGVRFRNGCNKSGGCLIRLAAAVMYCQILDHFNFSFLIRHDVLI